MCVCVHDRWYCNKQKFPAEKKEVLRQLTSAHLPFFRVLKKESERKKRQKKTQQRNFVCRCVRCCKSQRAHPEKKTDGSKESTITLFSRTRRETCEAIWDGEEDEEKCIERR